MVSQRREKERPRRKHSHDHGQKRAATQHVSFLAIWRLPSSLSATMFRFSLIFIYYLLIFFYFFFPWIYMLTFCSRYLPLGGRQNGYSASRALGRGAADYDSCSSFMSSELESTSCFDSEDDDATSRSDVLFSVCVVGGMHQKRTLAEILQNKRGFSGCLIFSRNVSPLCCCQLSLPPYSCKLDFFTLHTDKLNLDHSVRNLITPYNKVYYRNMR